MTLQQVAVATGGTRGDVVLTTSDGRAARQPVVRRWTSLNPLTNPVVLATNPPDQSIVALPLVADHGHLRPGHGRRQPDRRRFGDQSRPTTPWSGADGQAATIVGVNYDQRHAHRPAAAWRA